MRSGILRLAIAASAVLAFSRTTGAREGFDPLTAPFAITFHDEISSYRDTASVVMPGAAVVYNAVGGPSGRYAAATDAGTLLQQGDRQWRWIAPERPGTYAITFDGPGKHAAIVVHAFVMVPATEVKHGMLNGYRIGEYPVKPLKGDPNYLPPSGFIEVTAENLETKVSPHFTLKQFLCKEDTTKNFPKYVLFKERLPLKLEAVLEQVNTLGFKVDQLHVMSAFRTPFYNRAIGDVTYSMHQWGSAADIYIEPILRDSKVLYDAIEQMLEAKPFAHFQGGMGFYPATPAHPPFVHVDVRGTPARWKG